MEVVKLLVKHASEISALFAFLSALAWVWSATVRVEYSLRDKNGAPLQNPSLGFDAEGGRYNVRETMIKQSFWNGVAAMLSACAAFAYVCQAFSQWMFVAD
ncbi:hypothetical protein [Pseudomonas fulva]|uniref:hypothetical protein n=1 Tax=Pseudomonas fulva TaxID=47880 RepID=UPI003D032F56